MLSFRYFSIIFFVAAIVISYVVLDYYIKVFLETTIVQPIVKDQENTVKAYGETVWCKYSRVFKLLEEKKIPQKKWENIKYVQSFNKATQNALSYLPAKKITLYNKSEQEIYVSNTIKTSLFDQEDKQFAESSIKAALEQTSTYRIIKTMGIEEAGVISKGTFIQNVVAFSTKSCSQSEKNNGDKIAVNILYDISSHYEQIQKYKIHLLIGILLMLTILYVSLFISSHRSEAVINKQHDEKVALEKAKTKAEMQNQQKSMFLANVSHELRTPLNAIIGFSEILKDETMGPLGNDQYKDYAADINNSGVHLLSLINDILDFSKAEAMKLEVDSVDIDLTKITDSSIRLVEPRAAEAKVKLVENLPDEHVIVTGDPKRMKQVILNLLSNSVKFTPEDGEVSVTLKPDQVENKVTITVSDTGIGISQKNISKALSPFGQIDSSLSRRYEGTGLGLPLTKKLTELMGGDFDIKSEEGLGTTITLTFPIKAGPAEKDEQKF